MPKIDPLIAIGLPTWGKVSVSWAQSYRHLGGPLGANTMELQPVVGKPIAQARNEIMQGAIDNGADFLFMIGDDVICQPDTIIKMVQRMWDDPSVSLLTGMYWTKSWPTQPYIWRGLQRGPYLDWKYGEFFELDFAGCDCLMIRLTPEIKALGPAWFATDWKWNQEDGMSLLATEDFYFYTKARKAGIKLWCDSTIQCVHEDRNSGMQFALTMDMPQYTEAQPWLPEPGEGDLVRVADIGCGFFMPWFGTAEKVKITRFDGNEKVLPDFRCDIRHLPASDQSFDVVHSRHVLEHFGRDELIKVMTEWLRVLRVGGEFRISVPNIIHALTGILMMEEGVSPIDRYPWWQLYGEQTDHYDFHRNGFTPKRVQQLLEHFGMGEIEVHTGNAKPGEDLNTNIFARGIKLVHIGPEALVPDWDIIGTAEGRDVEGLAHEPETTTEARGDRRGVPAQRPPVPAGAAAAAAGPGQHQSNGGSPLWQPEESEA